MSGEDQRFPKVSSLRSLCSLRLAEEFNRRERRPAEPEIRNPKLEIRNKSELMGMGQWTNGKPRRFFAGCEQFRLLRWREHKGRQAVGQSGAFTCRVKTNAFPSSLPGFLWLTWGGYPGAHGTLPRAMRVECPGAIYHVMDRGHRRARVEIRLS